MALSEYQKEQIRSYVGSMTYEQIAEKVGTTKRTVIRVLQSAKVTKSVTKSDDSPARTPAFIIEPKVTKGDKIGDKMGDESDLVLSPEALAFTLLNQIKDDLETCRQSEDEKQSEEERVKTAAEWRLVNYKKLLHNNLKLASQWFGMDKGDVLKAIEEIRADPLAGMTKEELLRLYEVTE